MLKQIIKNNDDLKYAEVVAVCEWKGNLVALPCDNAMSGYYPKYKHSVIIKEDVEDLYGELDALLLIKQIDEYEVVFATDSWDGFQPASIEDINDIVEFIKWLALYI